MHNNHLSAKHIRARILRAIDPCQLRTAVILRQGETLFSARVWPYRRSSLSAGLAMALSGILSGSTAMDCAMVLSDIPPGMTIQPDDELSIAGSAGSWRIIDVAGYPSVGAAAVITLTLKAV